MKNLIYTIIILIIFFAISCGKKITDADRFALREKGNSISLKLQTKLLEELQASITANGAANSIDKCSLKSPEIEKLISENENAIIRRVSDNYRNPAHKPTQDEQNSITLWKLELEKGNKDLFPMTVESEDGIQYMKPIIISSPTCLKCHGKENEIEPETLKKIKEKYPEDKATGYEMGQLRGAITIFWKK